MRQPELFGLVFVGATLGAVCGGGAMNGMPGHIVAGAIFGAALLPAAVAVPWSRLRRRAQGGPPPASNPA